jgi:hypothetical protein
MGDLSPIIELDKFFLHQTPTNTHQSNAPNTEENIQTGHHGRLVGDYGGQLADR